MSGKDIATLLLAVPVAATTTYNLVKTIRQDAINRAVVDVVGVAA